MSGNVKFIAYDAVALARTGRPTHLDGPLLFSRPLPVYARLPRLGRLAAILNRTRVIPELQEPGLQRANLISSELLFRFLARCFGSTPLDRRLRWAQRMFDFVVASRLGAPSVFQFTSGAGLRSVRRARRRGAFTVCVRRALHHEVEAAWVREFSDRRDSYRHPEQSLAREMDEEYRLSDLIICNSHLATRTLVEKGVPAEVLRVVHNGVDLNRFKPKTLSRSKKLRILYVGSLDERKGCDLLARALANADFEFTFRVAGRGNPALLAKLSEAGSDTQMLGTVTQGELVEHYHWADVLVLPSFADSFGFVVTEAMACGTPAIATDRCGASELIDSGRNGFVVPTGDEAALRTRLTECANDRSILERMHRELVATRERLGWERYMSELAEIYERDLPDAAGSLVPRQPRLRQGSSASSGLRQLERSRPR